MRSGPAADGRRAPQRLLSLGAGWALAAVWPFVVLVVVLLVFDATLGGAGGGRRARSWQSSPPLAQLSTSFAIASASFSSNLVASVATRTPNPSAVKVMR